MISIIIPSRNDPYLQKTIDDILRKAEKPEDIEIFAMLDGYWPDPVLTPCDQLTIVHSGEAIGMRKNINAAAAMARGQYLMKCDAHCCFDHAFDKNLKEHSGENTLQVPRRWFLDKDLWCAIEPFIDQMYIRPPEKGFKGKVWKNWQNFSGNKIEPGFPVFDLMTFQGSCWFMEKALFEKIGGLDIINYGSSGKEAQELGNKVWLSGGRVIRNTQTWYAHLRFNRTYSLPDGEREKSEKAAINIWMNNLWPGQTLPFSWLVRKFNPPEWEGYNFEKNYLIGDVQIGGAELAETIISKRERELSMNPVKIESGENKGFDFVMMAYGADLGKRSPVVIPGFKRRHLSYVFNDMDFKKGAEIGVAWGRYSEVLCQNIPGLELLCVDPWSVQDDDPRHLKDHDKNYAEASRRLKPFNATLMRMRSTEAALTVQDESLDFVYIDGNHIYEAVSDDLRAWSKKVRKGGVISGHDYFRFKNAGVIKAVDEFVEISGVKRWFLTKEKAPSWFFIKE